MHPLPRFPQPHRSADYRLIERAPWDQMGAFPAPEGISRAATASPEIARSRASRCCERVAAVASLGGLEGFRPRITRLKLLATGRALGGEGI